MPEKVLVDSEHPLSIFISHRHDDKKIADVIKNVIEDWMTGQDYKIFQSSDPEHAPTIGEPLSEQLAEEVENADLVLLIYTESDADWSYCMFESGLASSAHEVNTRIVVFQFGSEAPAPLEHIIRIEYSADNERKTLANIQTFTKQFHSNKDFFPRLGCAFAPNTKEKTLSDRSQRLFLKLQEVNPTRPPEEIQRWMFLKLSLKLTLEELQKIVAAEDDQSAFQIADPIIRDKCIVETDSSNYAPRRFGYEKFSKDLPLWHLYNSWFKDLKNWNERNKKNYESLDWFSELSMEITRVLRGRQAAKIQVPFKSVGSGDMNWYLPVLSRASFENNRCEWLFFVELYGIPEEGEYLKIKTSASPEESEQNIQLRELEQQLAKERAQNEVHQNEIIRLREKLIQQEFSLKTLNFEVLTVDKRGEEVKREKGQAQYFTEDLGYEITLDMVYIRGDTFMMGSLESEGADSEMPQHEVTVQPFFMGRYPITQAQWNAIASALLMCRHQVTVH